MRVRLLNMAIASGNAPPIRPVIAAHTHGRPGTRNMPRKPIAGRMVSAAAYGNGLRILEPMIGLIAAMGRVRKVNTENAAAAEPSSSPNDWKMVGIHASIAYVLSEAMA